MFKRVTKRAERREQAEKLGATDDMRMQDTDSDESDSDEGDGSSDDSQNKLPTLGKKRKRSGEEEEEDAGTENEEATDEEDTENLSSMTVKEVLKSPLEGSSCIVCPGKQMKNPHMEKIHLQSGHHKRRLKRFEALVERLSSKFEDVYEDQAALLVRLLEKPSIESAPNPASESNRAKKKRKYEAQKEKRRLKRESQASKIESKQRRKKRKKDSEGEKQIEVGAL